MAFPSGWLNRAAITIQTGQIVGTLTDWPMWIDDQLIRVSNPGMIDANGAAPCLTDGGDIRFSSDASGATQLACQVEECVLDNDPDVSRLSIWVKIPSAAALTVSYIWWGKAAETQPAAGDSFGSQAVWNSNYLYVLHMNAAVTPGGANCLDSTSAARDFAGFGTGDLAVTTGASAKIRNKAIDFDGATRYLKRLDEAALKPANFAWQGWVQADDYTSFDMLFIKSNGGTWSLGVGMHFMGDVNTLTFWVNDYNTAAQQVVGNNPALGTWFFVAVSFDAATIKIKVGANAWVTKAYAAAIVWDTDAFYIGTFSGGPRFDGRMDEVRCLNSVKSQAWFDADYLNQSAPTTFGVMATAAGPAASAAGPTSRSRRSISLGRPRS